MACACHSMCVEARGKPWVLVLTFNLAWKQGLFDFSPLYCVPGARLAACELPGLSLLDLLSLAFGVLGLEMCTTVPSFMCVLAISTQLLHAWGQVLLSSESSPQPPESKLLKLLSCGQHSYLITLVLEGHWSQVCVHVPRFLCAHSYDCGGWMSILDAFLLLPILSDRISHWTWSSITGWLASLQDLSVVSPTLVLGLQGCWLSMCILGIPIQVQDEILPP